MTKLTGYEPMLPSGEETERTYQEPMLGGELGPPLWATCDRPGKGLRHCGSDYGPPVFLGAMLNYKGDFVASRCVQCEGPPRDN